MASVNRTGAVALFVGTRGAKGATPQPEFLGTCERFPRHELRPEYVPVYADKGGTKVPYDYAFQGATAVLSLTLTRWNESVFQALERFPGPVAGSRGEYLAKDVGALMGLQKHAVPVWVRYTAVPKVVPGGLPRGYRFRQALVLAPQETEAGARPMKRQVILLAWPLPVGETGGFTPGVSTRHSKVTKFVLWDDELSGLPPLD